MLSFKEYVNEIKSRFSDEVNQDLVFELRGKKLEFKSKNEKNPNNPKYNLFTYKEALECQKGGWRLPTEEELHALCRRIFYRLDPRTGNAVFDRCLVLPVCRYRGNSKVFYVGEKGYYWTSDVYGSDSAWILKLALTGAGTTHCFQYHGLSVRLVREV